LEHFIARHEELIISILTWRLDSHVHNRELNNRPVRRDMLEYTAQFDNYVEFTPLFILQSG